MKRLAYILIIQFISLLFFIQGCAVADTEEGDRPFDTDSQDSEGDSPSDTTSSPPTDTEPPDSSDSESSSDSLNGDDTETEETTGGDTATETLPPDDTEWEDTSIIHFWTFEGSDGDFTATSISGLENPWEWGIPNAEENIYYPSNPDGRVWGTKLNAVHGPCETAALTSKEFDLSPHAGKTVSISWEHSIYYFYDAATAGVYKAGLAIEVYNGSAWVAPGTPTCAATGCSCDTGWTTAAFSMSCDSSPLYLDGKPGFGGNSCPWEKQTVTITWQSYPANFKFRFIHGASSVDAKPGAYIDNVELSVME